jgi:hypothetical protein
MDNIRRRGEEFDDIGRLISEQLYSDRSHFVYELLQNAEDALARRFRINPNDIVPRKVQFKLFRDRLEFRHFGVPFNEEDVKGISDVLKGTKKEDIVQIGKFGIGFKSVYAFTASPEIHSGKEHFIIKRYIRPEAKWHTFPIDENETVFNFPFDHEELRAKEAFELILGKLRGLGPRVLLFLRWIDEIEWSVEPDGEKGQYLKKAVEIRNRNNARRITVKGQSNGMDENENWLVFQRYVKAPNQSDGYMDNMPVEIGFLLESIAKEKTERIMRIKDSKLVVFFPTVIPTGFGFLVQGPYNTTSARDNIRGKDDWNVTLVRETASLIADVLSQLKELDLLDVSLLEALPIRMDDFPPGSMFLPIVTSVRESLAAKELLPADNGTFVSARNAKLASAEWLRKQLREEQLKLLYKTELKWISGEITERGRHDLWKYIREELEIEEITPDSFARKVDSTFFMNQTDQWIVDFYRQLLNQKALWKKGTSSYWDSDGPIRKKPFIRLQDGSHVTPFDDDDKPNAYIPGETELDVILPTVKAEIIKDDEARRFLSDLKIPEFDIVAEVIEHVIPKYTLTPPPKLDEHQRDIEKILKAFKTDSQEKRARLKKTLQESPFILARSSTFDNAIYRKPCELYFHDDTLEIYFSGNSKVGFVSLIYQESVLDVFKDLGVSEDVRIDRKPPDYRGFVKIMDWHSSHERGLCSFDPNIQVEGLNHAFASPTIEKSVFIWNCIAIPNAVCIRGTVERSSRQTYENSSKEERISESFGRLLRESEWLPGTDGQLHYPSELSLNALPEQFESDEKLAAMLDMKKDVVAKLAEEAGIQTEDIDFLRKYPEEFNQWKASIVAKKGGNIFPNDPVKDSERRREKLEKELADLPEKVIEDLIRKVRISRRSVDPHVYLRQKYTNNNRMVCQICKMEMPFRKRNGEYYFEAVEAFSNDYFPREHEAQYLALCPVCAARYKEFVKLDESAMEDLHQALKSSDEPELSLTLGELETSIWFVASHFLDIKKILDTGIEKLNEIQPKGAKQMLSGARPTIEIIDKDNSSSKAPQSRDMVQCPICEVPVKSTNLEKHKRKVHGNSASLRAKATRRKKKTMTPTTSKIGRCRSCGSPAVPGSDYCYSCQ